MHGQYQVRRSNIASRDKCIEKRGLFLCRCRIARNLVKQTWRKFGAGQFCVTFSNLVALDCLVNGDRNLEACHGILSSEEILINLCYFLKKINFFLSNVRGDNCDLRLHSSEIFGPNFNL